MEIKFYSQRISEFIAGLDKPSIAKTLRTLDLLEKFGNKLNMPHSKKLCAELFELRIRGKNEIRIIYCFCRNKIVLLHGFIKKSQKTPERHIQLAKKRFYSIDSI